MRALRKTIITAITLILHTLLFGCAEKPDPRLLSAQRDMDLNPDSIANILLAIDTTRLSGQNKATYYLLLTQSLHKSNRLDSDTRQIDMALNYFNQHGDDREKMMANFYKGIILQFGNDYEGAMHHSLIAYDLATKLNDNYWIAKTAESIADLYSLSYLYHDAWEYEEKAIHHYMKAGKMDNHLFAVADHGLSLFNGGREKNGIWLCDSIKKIALKEDQIELNLYVSHYLLYFYIDKGNLRRAEETYVDLLNLGDTFDESYLNSMIAQMFFKMDNVNKGMLHLKIAHDKAVSLLDSLEYYHTVLRNIDLIPAQCTRDNLLDTILYVQNENVKKALKQPLYKASSDYYYNQAELQRYKAQTRLIILILSLTILCTILVLIIFFAKNRLRRKEEKIINLKINYENLIKRKDLLSASILKLLRSNFDSLNQLSSDYINGWDNDVQKKIILKRLEKELKSWSDSKRVKEIENYLNLYVDDVCNKLRRQCNFLKENELAMIFYLWIGFTPKAITIFLQINIKTLYTNRSRIIVKIEQSNPPDKELFLKLFK
ncbi:MAG: hypothetical protein K2K81_08165 [Muribaculaceae bacterium]|nr:hypothetical protein [Muribaculaceae bacterium]